MYNTAQKMKFAIENFFSKWPNPQENCIFCHITEEILNAKFDFFKQYKDLLFPSQLIQLTSRQL